MSKLAETELNNGRDFIRAYDMDGFMGWLGQHYPTYVLNREEVRKTYALLFKAKEHERALRLFEAIAGIDVGEKEKQFRHGVRVIRLVVGLVVAFIVVICATFVKVFFL